MEFGTNPAIIALLAKKTQQTREKVTPNSNLWGDSGSSQPSRVALMSLQWIAQWAMRTVFLWLKKTKLTGGVDILSFGYWCTRMSCLEGRPPSSPQPQDEASTWRGGGAGAHFLRPSFLTPLPCPTPSAPVKSSSPHHTCTFLIALVSQTCLALMNLTVLRNPSWVFCSCSPLGICLMLFSCWVWWWVLKTKTPRGKVSFSSHPVKEGSMPSTRFIPAEADLDLFGFPHRTVLFGRSLCADRT